MYRPLISSSKAILYEEESESESHSYGVIKFSIHRGAGKQEYRISLHNKSLIATNCDFMVYSTGYQDEMHTFYTMPFKALIKPSEGITITLCIKGDIMKYDNSIAEKLTEMRKLLIVKIADTRIQIVVPLLIHFANKIKEED